MRVESYNLLIICDGPHAPEQGERPIVRVIGESKENAETLCRKYGWIVEMEMQICPKCVLATKKRTVESVN